MKVLIRVLVITGLFVTTLTGCGIDGEPLTPEAKSEAGDTAN